MQEQDKNIRYQMARERVSRIKCFYGNLTAYSIVIPILAWINYNTTSFPWILFPMAGWGMGLIMNGLDAFGYNPFLGRNWEQRKIRELMTRDDF